MFEKCFDRQRKTTAVKQSGQMRKMKVKTKYKTQNDPSNKGLLYNTKENKRQRVGRINKTSNDDDITGKVVCKNVK